jgi:hypothetical protein
MFPTHLVSYAFAREREKERERERERVSRVETGLTCLGMSILMAELRFTRTLDARLPESFAIMGMYFLH